MLQNDELCVSASSVLAGAGQANLSALRATDMAKQPLRLPAAHFANPGKKGHIAGEEKERRSERKKARKKEKTNACQALPIGALLALETSVDWLHKLYFNIFCILFFTFFLNMSKPAMMPKKTWSIKHDL